jgi:hypothetical protein
MMLKPEVKLMQARQSFYIQVLPESAVEADGQPLLSWEVEVYPPFPGATQAGLVVSWDDQHRTPLWFGEATDAAVVYAFNQQLRYFRDVQGSWVPRFEVLSSLPMVVGLADGLNAFLLYFDVHRRLQGVSLAPLSWGSGEVRLLGHSLRPTRLERASGCYDTFLTPIEEMKASFQAALAGDCVDQGVTILYPQAGTVLYRSQTNPELMAALAVFAPDHFAAVQQEAEAHP